MSRNLYKETFDRIKISEEAINKALETSRNYDNSKSTKKNKIIKFKAISMIAASLAVVIALTAVLSGLTGGNSFVLTAYADEITNESYVSIGEKIDNSGGSLIYLPNGTVHITEVFDFFVHCDGKNIKSISYTANNCKFLVDTEYDGILSYSHYSNNYGDMDIMEKTTCSSYTIAYDKQPVYENYRSTKCTCDNHIEVTEEEFENEYSNYLPPISLAIEVNFPMVIPEEEEDISKYYYDSVDKVYDKIINGVLDYTVDITVNYDNGETDTQTLIISCAKNSDSSEHYTLTGKLKK